MLNMMKTLLVYDWAIYLCAAMGIFLLWRYKRTKDMDFVYFFLSSIFYLLGGIYDAVFGKSLIVPIDFIFFFMFYFFIFLFLKKRTKSLLKNPMISMDTELKTWIIIIIDYVIVAVFSYLIFYYFDRISLYSPPVIHRLRFSMIINFLYPVLDFLLLGYYIGIDRKYTASDRKVYLPLIAGISIWAIGDFLLAYEEMFRVKTYGIGDALQIVGLVMLIVILVIIKSYKTESNYTTIDLYWNNSKLVNYNLLMNCLILLYIAIYIFCLTSFSYSSPLMFVVNGSGIILLVLVTLRYIIINQDIQFRLSKMSMDASTDPLTGLFSRKNAFSLIQSLYESSLYFNTNMSVLMIDIDYFKKYNDVYGHMHGDCVLKDIAQLMSSNIETSNIICRYGGEEFLIVLPGVDQHMGMQIAEKIRASIEKIDFHKGEQLTLGNVTVSIGGATTGSKTRNGISLVEQADAALYKAKEERNRSVWFSYN